MADDEVDVDEGHVALHHVQRRVAEDPLEAEHIAAVDKVAPSERVAERVRAASPRDPGPALEGASRGEGARAHGCTPRYSRP